MGNGYTCEGGNSVKIVFIFPVNSGLPYKERSASAEHILNRSLSHRGTQYRKQTGSHETIVKMVGNLQVYLFPLKETENFFPYILSSSLI